MEWSKFNNMIAERTSEITGVKPSVVKRIIRQYYEQIKDTVRRMDIMNMTDQDFDAMSRKAVYVPGLGKFILDWNRVRKWRSKHEKEEYDD